uniref:Uncharacterized protein n=1 Tax=Acrobeloides nanus TaxID=290746 RepID=A0A914CWR9_9BILA
MNLLGRFVIVGTKAEPIPTGALIIGYLALILGIIGLLTSVTKGNGQGIVSNVLSVIIGGCILYADKSHKPIGYLPYLIVTAIGISISTVFIALFVIMAIFGLYSEKIDPERHYYAWEDLQRSFSIAMSQMLFVMAAVMAFVECIAIWFWMVVYRAYQHMKGVEEYDRGQTYQVKFNDV